MLIWRGAGQEKAVDLTKEVGPWWGVLRMRTFEFPLIMDAILD